MYVSMSYLSTWRSAEVGYAQVTRRAPRSHILRPCATTPNVVLRSITLAGMDISDTKTLEAHYQEERECDFEDVEGQGQLSIRRNETIKGPDGQLETRLRPHITHHSNILGQKVIGSVDKILWGRYKDRTACLLVLRFRFIASTGLFRLRKAAVMVRFLNHGPNADSGPARPAPVVRAFSPGNIFGIPTEVEHEYAWEATAQFSLSSGFVEAGPEVTRGHTMRYTTEDTLEIAGMSEPDEDHDLDNKVVFEIDENSAEKRGVPRELYFGVLVECEGPIQADVRTTIGDRSAWPWTTDDPIVVKPGVAYGSLPQEITRKFEQLTDENWSTLVPYSQERVNRTQIRIE